MLRFVVCHLRHLADEVQRKKLEWDYNQLPIQPDEETLNFYTPTLSSILINTEAPTGGQMTWTSRNPKPFEIEDLIQVTNASIPVSGASPFRGIHINTIRNLAKSTVKAIVFYPAQMKKRKAILGLRSYINFHITFASAVPPGNLTFPPDLVAPVLKVWSSIPLPSASPDKPDEPDFGAPSVEAPAQDDGDEVGQPDAEASQERGGSDEMEISDVDKIGDGAGMDLDENATGAL